MRGRIETLQKELADTEESKSEAADALRESERAIIAANRKLAALTREYHEANDKLSQLQAQSRQVARDIEVQQSTARQTASSPVFKWGRTKGISESIA